MKLQLMKLRKDAGYKSRDAFAEKLGVNKHTYRSWETGAAQMNAEQLLMCAIALDCSCDAILGREIPTEFSDPREAELHAVWKSLSNDGKNHVLHHARAESALERGGEEEPQQSKAGSRRSA